MRIAARINLSGTTGFWSDFGEVHAATAHSGYPETNLKTDPLTFGCRAYGPMTSQTLIYGTLAKRGAATDLGVIAALATGREKSFAVPEFSFYPAPTWRARVDRYPLVDRVRPAITSVALTNLTGAFGTIANIVDPPYPPIPTGYAQTKLTATAAGSDTIVTVSFANNTSGERQLSTAASAHHFYAHYRMSDGSASVPEVRAVLRQSGADVMDMGDGGDQFNVITTPEGWLFHWANVSFTMPSSTGAIQVRLTGATIGTATPEPIDVSWVAELAGLDYDSGTLPAAEICRVLPDLAIPSGDERHFLIEFSDYCLYEVVVGVEMLPVILEPAQVGRFIAAETIEIVMSADGWGETGANNDAGEFMRSGYNRATIPTQTWKESTVRGRYWDAQEIVGATGLAKLIDATSPLLPVLVCPFDAHPEFDRFARIVSSRIDLVGQGINGRTGQAGYFFDVELELREIQARTAPRR